MQREVDGGDRAVEFAQEILALAKGMAIDDAIRGLGMATETALLALPAELRVETLSYFIDKLLKGTDATRG